MRREILALVLFSLASFAAFDQSYVQTVGRDGNSTIQKSMQLTIFGQLNAQALSGMEQYCSSLTAFDCSVDPANKTVTITDAFSSGGYYEYTTDYGLPFVTHTLTITRIPTDRFSNLLDRLLAAGNVSGAGGGGSTSAIDLRDNSTNIQNAAYLRQFGANITYTVVRPADVSSAAAGNVSGSVAGRQATFDLVEVLGASKPIVVKSSELNLGYITAIVGLVVIIALAVAFVRSRTVKRR